MQENNPNPKKIICDYLKEHFDLYNTTTLSDKIESVLRYKEKLVIIVNCNTESSNEIDQKRNERTQILYQAASNFFGNITVEIIFTNNSNTNTNKVQNNKAPKNPKEKRKFPNIKKVIIVASGKGGVGKSTIAANLAANLANKGLQIGLLDADIYGPSISHMFNLHEQPKLHNQKFIPFKKNEVYIMSIGCFIEKEKAAMWRGPMVSKVLFQLAILTEWPNLDILIIDTPPGTGDVHMSLYEDYYLNGAIVVTTPQQISYNDTIKIVDMLNTFHIPILGVVENMKFIDHQNTKEELFAGNAGQRLQSQIHPTPPLIQIPFNQQIALAADQGLPLIAAYPHSDIHDYIDQIICSL